MKEIYGNNPSKDYYNAVIIGAGPAGLAAANTLTKGGNIRKDDALLIACGKTADNRINTIPEDITCGFGGAGLFSDGKFSFYPSAEKLW